MYISDTHTHTHIIHLDNQDINKDFDPFKLFNEHLKIFINNQQKQNKQ